MLRLSSDIHIGQYQFSAVVGVEVESSWDMFTDVCRITIPRKINWRDKPIAVGESALLRRGDTVKVSLGYDDNNTEIFQGYLHEIEAGIPTTIHCQDEMWNLKQQVVTESWENVSLDTLLSSILPSSVPYQALGVSLGPFRITNATVVQVLDELKKEYFLKSWFRNGTLYVGFAYLPELQNEYVVRFNRNVVDNNLEYQRKADIRIRLKMISVQPDNSRIEYEAGDAGGELRTMYYYDKTLEDLKALADSEIERLRYDGYKGDMTIFGQPTFRHGDVVDLRDEIYPERDGRYLIKKVTYIYGVGGFRQKLELDSKI